MADLGSLVMDFVKGAASPFQYLARTDITNPIRELASGESQASVQNSNQSLGLGASGSNLAGGLRQWAGNAAQVGLDVAAPAVGKAIAAPVSAAVGGGIAGTVTGGAAAGTAIGGAFGAASGVASQQKLNPKNLSMDFLKNAAFGAALGGVGGAIGGALKAAKPVYASDQLSQDDLNAIAKSDNPTEIEKKIEPVTGPVIAKELSPTIAQDTDANTVKNQIDQALSSKLSTPQQQSTPVATPVNSALPSPTEMPPTTPVSDVNTPQQVAQQGSAAEAAYNPNQTELGAVGKDVTEPTPEQSSLDQTAPPDFMNAPGEAPTPNHVSKVGTMSEMGEILNQGGTTEEALSHYMTQVPGATLGDAQDALDQTIKSAGVDKSKINASENPQTGKVSFAPVKEGDDTGAQLNGRYAGEKVGQNGAPAYRAMEALDATDRESTRFLRGKSDAQVQTLIDNAHNPKAFRDYVNASKNYNDYAQASGAELGQPLPYRVNYGGRTAYDPPEGLPEGGKPGATNPNTPSYTQQRYFNTHEEALANGYTPRYDDPLEELKNDINQRGYNQTQLALAKGYEDAHPGQVQLLNDTTPIKAGYHQLVVPGGEHIALPKELADPINTRIMTSTPGKILGKYDTINAAGKQLELGGGLFHGFNTMGTFVGQQLTSLKALTDPGALGKVVSNFFSDKNMEDYVAKINDASLNPSGGVDTNHSVVDGGKASGLNIKNTSVDLENPGNTTLSSKIANIPGLKQIHASVFDRQIPTMMLETFKQKTAGLDIFGSGDDRLAAEKIARGINKEFGVTDHDLAGMTSQQFKSAGRFLLAPGYQEGVIHTLLTALDPRSIGTSEGLLARQAVIGKALVMGGLATAGAVAGGDFNGMTPKQVALGIMNKAINPSFKIGGYKVSTPATFISDVAKPIEESVAGAKAGHGIAAGPEDFASSHLAFLPSKAEEFGANKNYAGNAVYGKDYYGRPISGATTAENVASGVLPIPLAQTSQAVAGNQSTSAAIANTLGFNVSDETANNINYAPVAAQTYLQQLQATPGVSKEAIQSATKFVAALGAGDTGRSKVLTKATSLLAQAEKSTNQSVVAKDEAQVQTLITNYNKQLATALQPWIQSDASTYTDNNMLKLLRDTMITNKNARSNVNYDIKTNPTSVGVPIAALAPTPTTQSNNLVPNSI